MHSFRAVVVGIAAACGFVTAPAMAGAEQPVPGVANLLHSWADAGAPSGGGTLDSPEGRLLLEAITSEGVPATRPSAVAYPPCQGTFPSNGAADITVQSSPVDGIPWLAKLTPANAQFGVVTLSAQVYADNHQANVYAPHTEPWDYTFHGPLPRMFQVIGGGTYTMPPGATVSFLFAWHSAAQPTQGGYAYLNCQFVI